MLEIARYETERQLLGAAVVAVAAALYAGLFLAIAPELIASVDMDAYVQAFPESVRKAFGIESLSTLEGVLATELYQFGWVILLGLYVAYLAGSAVAGDVERGRMEMLLSNPVGRRRVVVETYLALLAPILLVNVVAASVVYGGSVVVDDPLAPADVVAVHALSVPYLLACAGVGLVLSVLVDRESVAQRAAMGAVFGLFMLETLVSDTEYAAAGAVSPTRYYDPTAVLVRSSYDVRGAAILLVAAVALVAVAAALFRRVDIQ